jgi:uncharacterized protein (DUF58 family)
MTLAWRILYRLYRTFSGVWYWVERRFTRAGLVVLVTFAAAGMMAPDTDNTVSYQAFTLLLFLMVVAVSCTWFFRGKFSVSRLLPRFGTVGRPLIYRVAVKNLTAKTQRGLTVLEGLADTRPSFQDWRASQLSFGKDARSFRLSQHRRLDPFRAAAIKDGLLPPAPPGEEAEVKIEITPLRRGVLRFKSITLARADPLGLFRAFVKVPLPQTVLVLPRRYPVPPISLSGTMRYQEGGVALAASVGHSEEFVALRDYRHGDPYRHIHWRSWARTGKPVVKEFEDEFFVRHALILDTFLNAGHSELFEEAVSVAASFACALQTQESLLDLLFVGSQSYCFTAGRGLAHVDQMLEVLASVRACPDQPFAQLEHLVLNHVKAVSGCICVLVCWDAPRRAFVQKLQQLGLPVMVLVLVQPGERGSMESELKTSDTTWFHVLELGRVEHDLAALK